MKAEMHRDALGDWNVIYKGRVVMEGETYQVAANIVYALNNPDRWDTSEAYEVAENIRAKVEG